MRASWMPVDQSCSAKRWSLPMRRARACNFGAEIPRDLGTCTPKYSIFARTLGLPRLLSSRNTPAQVQRVSAAGGASALERFVGVEEDGDRTFIDKLHGHHGLKNSSSNGNAELAKSGVEMFIQPRGLLGGGGGDKAETALAASVAV